MPRKSKAPQGNQKKAITPRIDAEVIERARGAAVAVPFHTGKACSFERLVEDALIDYLKKLERKWGKIRPLPAGSIKPGPTTMKRG